MILMRMRDGWVDKHWPVSQFELIANTRATRDFGIYVFLKSVAYNSHLVARYTESFFKSAHHKA
ncbi:unannotated protein [freshwater metagenome]|uniref:Unannotated protein n=1 Tax=freshwater metagenome TaxID=449393 RepID=A0A6J6DA84_9ZZZZ